MERLSPSTTDIREPVPVLNSVQESRRMSTAMPLKTNGDIRFEMPKPSKATIVAIDMYSSKPSLNLSPFSETAFTPMEQRKDKTTIKTLTRIRFSSGIKFAVSPIIIKPILETVENNIDS